jgi:hypothetical protein
MATRRANVAAQITAAAAENNGYLTTSQSALAEFCGCSVGTVNRVLHDGHRTGTWRLIVGRDGTAIQLPEKHATEPRVAPPVKTAKASAKASARDTITASISLSGPSGRFRYARTGNPAFIARELRALAAELSA